MEVTLIVSTRYETGETFLSEQGLRDWVKKWSRTEQICPGLWWVEPGIGGSEGYPDLTIGRGGRVCFAELKLGKMVVGGAWKVKIRPAQRVILREMVQAGLRCIVLVGGLGCGTVVVAEVDGKGSMDVLHQPMGAAKKPLSLFFKDLLQEP